MEYKNNTDKGIRVPVQQDGLNPVAHMTFHSGDVKELPDSAKNAAILLGLDLVVEKPKMQKKEDVKVKALKSSIKKKVVETKQIEAE